mgnify:CR=1 FL=1
MNYTECIENAKTTSWKILQGNVLNATAAHAKTRCPVPAQRASETQPYATTTNGNKSV